MLPARADRARSRRGLSVPARWHAAGCRCPSAGARPSTRAGTPAIPRVARRSRPSSADGGSRAKSSSKSIASCSGRSKLAASRSRHGVVRSHARSTTYAELSRSAARASASTGSATSSESSRITSTMCRNASRASSCPCGHQISSGGSKTMIGSTIVSRPGSASVPRSISTCSADHPNDPRRRRLTVVHDGDRVVASRGPPPPRTGSCATRGSGRRAPAGWRSRPSTSGRRSTTRFSDTCRRQRLVGGVALAQHLTQRRLDGVGRRALL